MFPSTFRYLGTRSITNSLSHEKIKIHLKKVMFPSVFRYLGTKSVLSDVRPLDKISIDIIEWEGINNEKIIRPLTIVLQINKLFSHLVKLKEYPKDMARSLSHDIDNSEISAYHSTLYHVFNCYCLSKRLRVDFGLSILARLFKNDCVPNEVLSYKSRLDGGLSGMFKENRSCETKELFKKIVREKSCDIDAVTYGTLIDALCKEGHSMIAVEVLRIMEKKGHPRLHAQTLNMIIEGWIKERKIYYNMAYFYELLCYDMCEDSKEWNVYSAFNSFYTLVREDMFYGYIYDALVRGLCDMSLDRKIYPVVWTKGVKDEVKDALRAMMTRYCEKGQLRKAREVFRFMDRNNVIPKADCYNMLIAGYCPCMKKKKIAHVMNLVREMHHKGFKPKVYIYNSILRELFSSGRCSDALQIFDDMQVVGLKPNYFTYRNMLHGLCQNSQVEQALSLMNALELEGAPLHIEYYNIVVEGCREDGQFERAKDLLLKMEQIKLVPNDGSYSSVV